ncbi:MAG: ABC transporter permease [Lachnospiraceae bacterium]|nr:ABC transporter permease [Lachnospiraceae bacterium]
MKKILYLKFAWNNIIKNKYLYIPNIITGTGLIAVFYILMTLSTDDQLANVHGGSSLVTIMPYGTVIGGILSFILILYAGSFLMKQRKREFGIYNILGLEKRHVGRILFLESAISALISMISGLFFGIVLYKLCVLLICKILKVQTVLGFSYINPKILFLAAIIFAGFYIINMLLHYIQIVKMKLIELLQSSQSGEREPKIKWIPLIVGVLSLASGYFILLTTESPLKVLFMIFVAILLIILGTYCLFMVGIIALLKFLKSRKNFYYQKRYMTAVSSLLYRMKRNAVGFASITILACGVLLLMSSTICLYIGIEDYVKTNYPHQYTYVVDFYEENGETHKLSEKELRNIVEKATKKTNLKISQSFFYQYLTCGFVFRGGRFITEPDMLDSNIIVPNGAVCGFLTAKDYKNLTGEQADISSNEVLVYQPGGNKQNVKDSFVLDGHTFYVKSKIDDFPVSAAPKGQDVTYDFFGIILRDDTIMGEIDQFQNNVYQDANVIENMLAFDLENLEHNAKLLKYLCDETEKYQREKYNYGKDVNVEAFYGYSFSNRNGVKSALYDFYGNLLFLGLILSFVFVFATALIIYYKQISEGYEDRQRYQIMQKIGMSGYEVKSTIRSQIRIMFFLPIIVAAIHVSVAMPILLILLRYSFRMDDTLFIGCVAGALIVFILIYIIIYKVTAKNYYNIVKR